MWDQLFKYLAELAPSESMIALWAPAGDNTDINMLHEMDNGDEQAQIDHGDGDTATQDHDHEFNGALFALWPRVCTDCVDA
jgi:hypothetical protein